MLQGPTRSAWIWRSTWLAGAAALSLWCGAPRAAAQSVSSEGIGFVPSSPYAYEVRQHFYARLAKSSTKAFLWELTLPGAGNVYTGIYGGAIVTGVLVLAGAGMWIAGAVTDRDALWWAGMGTFTAGRAYGLVSAPIGARLLNRAFRRQLGIVEPVH